MERQPCNPTRHRTALIGAVLIVAAGMMTGGFLRAGDLFDTAGAPTPLAAAQPPEEGAVISYMMDADGRIPDYVVGTDVTVRPNDGRLYQADWAPDLTPPAAEDWSTAPSVSGDILNIGPVPSRETSPAGAAEAVGSHAIDASEVAASGATARVERKPVDVAAETQQQADRRDGQAALASAGFAASN